MIEITPKKSDHVAGVLMQSVAPVPANSIGLTSSRGVMTHVETEEGMVYLSIEESTRHLLDMAKFYHIRLENIKLE